MSLSVVLLVSVVSTLHASPSAIRGEVIPFVTLLADPDPYEGKLVTVYGYLRYRFEDIAVYQSKDDAEYGVVVHALWVYPSKDVRVLTWRPGEKNMNDLDGRYVLITGTFTRSRHGHLGAFWGALEQVKEIRELRRSK